MKDKHPVFQGNAHIIEEAVEVEVFTLESIPTISKLQEKNTTYFEDYKVLGKIDLSKEQIIDLKKIALDNNNYILQQQKKCPFQGAYAIKFFKKKHDYIVLLISEKNCERMLISSSEKDINKKYVDLATGNAIHGFLEKLKK